jgi:hypothetical protein
MSNNLVFYKCEICSELRAVDKNESKKVLTFSVFVSLLMLILLVLDLKAQTILVPVRLDIIVEELKAILS